MSKYSDTQTLMSELSIKVTIANRIYPLTIKREEEENVRKSAKLIDENIKELESNYAVKDKQDLLAMSALEFANRALERESKPVVEDGGVLDKLNEMNKMVDDYLEKV